MPGVEIAGSEWSDPDLRTVAGYRLLRLIGSGGMSTVFLSYDVSAGCPVAVKLLADHLCHSREFVSRFYREAHLSRLLSNPFLVRGFSAGYDPTVAKHYLILEYVDGPTAQTALNRLGRFPVGMAVKIGLDIAQALSFLHTRHYIHRDVKPDNILFHPSGTAKLADLGLAKRLNDDAHLTAVSQGVGTSYYMSYEQSVNANFVDGRSDIFALGATLYHLLAGDVPFPGATHEDIIKGKYDDAFCPLRQQNPEVPSELTEIIARTLVRDPRNRFQTADELANALKATGLATHIPALPQVNESDGSSNSVSAYDAPTRADLNTIGSNGTPSINLPRNPPAASFCQANINDAPANQASGTNRQGGGSRFVLGALAALSALGLGGLLATQNHPDLFRTQPPVSSKHESREPQGKGGLPVSVPQ
jgi:serine/threonine protein kinase